MWNMKALVSKQSRPMVPDGCREGARGSWKVEKSLTFGAWQLPPSWGDDLPKGIFCWRCWNICLEPGIPLDAWKALVDRTNAPVINVRCSQILGHTLSRHFTHWSSMEILWSKCSQWSVVQSPRGSGSGPRSSSQHPHDIYNPSPRGSVFWPPGYQTHVMCRRTQRQNIYTHNLIFLTSQKLPIMSVLQENAYNFQEITSKPITGSRSSSVVF